MKRKKEENLEKSKDYLVINLIGHTTRRIKIDLLIYYLEK